MRERVAMLAKLRDAGWPLGLALTAALLVEALIPAATAVTMGLLVSTVEQQRPTLLPLAAFAVILLVSHVADAANDPLGYAVRVRIDGAHRAAVARLAATAATLDVLERQRTRDLIRLASADPDNWTEHTPGDGVIAMLTVLISYLGVASSCAVLAAFSPFLVPGILLPAWCSRTLYLRRMRVKIRRWAAGISDGRRRDYWKTVATSAAEGKELRVFGFGRWVTDRAQHHVHAMYDPIWRAQLRVVKRGPLLTTIFCGIPLAVSYAIVAAGTAGGHHPVGTETAVLAAGYSVCVAAGLAFNQLAAESAQPSLRALAELRTVLAGAAEDHNQAELAEAPQPVLMKKVCFAYPGSDRQVLRDLDLEIKPGELLAIVGLNGAGKSTLIKLLSGLYRPSSGTITAGGTDITTALHQWRRRISVVFQDFARYELSVRDNVTLSGQIEEAALGAAARESGLDAVIARLPGGWDTPLSRSRAGGVDLSGGQWQQVVLARALYPPAWLLVLDEPTAHLDVRTEFELFTRLAGQRGRRSVVLISHRLSTVRQADRIVLLDGGRIAESGSHEELITRNGTYARMFALQAERFNELPQVLAGAAGADVPAAAVDDHGGAGGRRGGDGDADRDGSDAALRGRRERGR
jgi:ABC-type multidrug transport system fused ATPase/permease subunit